MKLVGHIKWMKSRFMIRTGLIFLVLLSSCSIERKLAQGFIDHPPAINFQLFTPETLYKYNHKGELIKGFDSLTSSQQDSALYYSSQFIQYVSDSVFLEKYMNAFIDELRSLGFKVFLEESIDTFLQNQPQSYIVSIAQIEMNEYKFPVEDSASYGDSTFYKKFDVNAVDASCWFELNKINAEKPVKTVLKSTFTATDSFEGGFILTGFSSNVLYKYRMDPLTLEDIYELAVYAGKKHANYLFDYFMNQYVKFNLPEGERMPYYLHYDHHRRSLGITEDEKFEVVTSK